MIASDGTYARIVAAYLAACVVLGGASAAGLAANMLLQIAGAALLVVGIDRLRRAPLEPLARWGLVLLAAIALLPVLQLVPLPASVWQAMPGRQSIVEGMESIGVQPFATGISLVPWRTLSAAVWMIVPVAVFVAMLSVDDAGRRRIGWTVLALIASASIVGLLQLAGIRPLYFYSSTNADSPVGFFQNRNAMATLLLCALPLLTLLLPSASREAQAPNDKWGRRIVLLTAMLFVIAMIALTGSRAGLGLSLPTLALCYALTLRSRSGLSPWPVLAGSAVIGLVVLSLLLYGPFVDRMAVKTAALGEDVRVVAAPITAYAGWKFFPFGTGMGTFDPVFRWQANGASVGPNFVNHAHNDYLEVWLTAGLPGVLLFLAFLAWFYAAARSTWTARSTNPGVMGRIATIGIIIMLLHSVVDYPLRTATLAALFAAFCAMQLAPAGARRLAGPAATRPTPRSISRRSVQAAGGGDDRRRIVIDTMRVPKDREKQP